MRLLGARLAYALDYHRGKFCFGQKYTVKATSNGHVSVYGCCSQ